MPASNRRYCNHLLLPLSSRWARHNKDRDDLWCGSPSHHYFCTVAKPGCRCNKALPNIVVPVNRQWKREYWGSEHRKCTILGLVLNFRSVPTHLGWLEPITYIITNDKTHRGLVRCRFSQYCQVWKAVWGYMSLLLQESFEDFLGVRCQMQGD